MTLEHTPGCSLLMRAKATQIGVVAKKVGLSVDAIRFYERNALLPRASRTKGGFRRYRCNLETQKCCVLPVGPLYPRPHGQARPVQAGREQDLADGTYGAATTAAQNPRERGCRKGEADSHGLTYVPTSYWQACGWNGCSSRTHRQGRCCQEGQICFRSGNLRVVRSQGSTAMAIRADVDEWRACRGGYHGLGSVSPTWEVAQLLVNAETGEVPI